MNYQNYQGVQRGPSFPSYRLRTRPVVPYYQKLDLKGS